MDNLTIKKHTVAIVSAYIRYSKINIGEIDRLIMLTYQSLGKCVNGKPQVEPWFESAGRNEDVLSYAFSNDYLTCLECGFKAKMLKWHIRTRHKMSPAIYRLRWSLPSDYPMVAPSYAARRAELRVELDLKEKFAAWAASRRG